MAVPHPPEAAQCAGRSNSDDHRVAATGVMDPEESASSYFASFGGNSLAALCATGSSNSANESASTDATSAGAFRQAAMINSIEAYPADL